MSVQVTAVLLVFVTVAENCLVAVACTVAVDGETEIVTAGTVMVAEFDLVVSVTEVDVIVTVRALVGGVAGAV
jgi:hypothetical protein